LPSVNFNDDFRIPFRNYILDDLEMNELIAQRFFGSQLATLFDPTFPLAVFYAETGAVHNLGIVQRFTIVIRAYSDVSYDEAYKIYKAIAERLGGTDGPITICPVDGINIVVRPITTPTETYEVEPRLHGVGGRFGVVLLT
jgi:hypothetical protein